MELPTQEELELLDELAPTLAALETLDTAPRLAALTEQRDRQLAYERSDDAREARERQQKAAELAVQAADARRRLHEAEAELAALDADGECAEWQAVLPLLTATSARFP